MSDPTAKNDSSGNHVRPFENEEADAIKNELLGESPRASVLVGVAWLDSYLRDLLALALDGDLRVQKVFLAPLRSLSQRIGAAHNLGVLAAKEKAIFQVLAEVRHRFAHRTSVSFDDHDVQSMVSKLHPYAAGLPITREIHTYDTRDVFILFTAFHAASLSARIRQAQGIEDLATRLDMLRFVANRIDEDQSE